MGNNFNFVLAESGVFLPANENLTRKPKTKKPQFCQWDPIHPISFNSATASSYFPVLLSPTPHLRRTLPPPKMNVAAAHAWEFWERPIIGEREPPWKRGCRSRERDWNWETKNAKEEDGSSQEDGFWGKSNSFSWSSTDGDLGRADGRIWGVRADGIWGELGADKIWGWLGADERDWGGLGADGFDGVVQFGWMCGDFGRIRGGRDLGQIRGGRDLGLIRDGRTGFEAN